MNHPPPPYAQSGSAPMGQRHVLAGWWQRLVARLIDWAVLFVPVAVVSSLLGVVVSGGKWLIGDQMSAFQFLVLVGVLFFVAYTTYDTVCVAKWRRTLGKRAMGLQVAPLAGAGAQGPIPVFSTVARSALLSLWMLGAGMAALLQLLVYLLTLVFVALWPLWDQPNGQGMHDKLAGTVVIRDD